MCFLCVFCHTSAMCWDHGNEIGNLSHKCTYMHTVLTEVIYYCIFCFVLCLYTILKSKQYHQLPYHHPFPLGYPTDRLLYDCGSRPSSCDFSTQSCPGVPLLDLEVTLSHLGKLRHASIPEQVTVSGKQNYSFEQSLPLVSESGIESEEEVCPKQIWDIVNTTTKKCTCQSKINDNYPKHVVPEILMYLYTSMFTRDYYVCVHEWKKFEVQPDPDIFVGDVSRFIIFGFLHLSLSTFKTQPLKISKQQTQQHSHLMKAQSELSLLRAHTFMQLASQSGVYLKFTVDGN